MDHQIKLMLEIVVPGMIAVLCGMYLVYWLSKRAQRIRDAEREP